MFSRQEKIDTVAASPAAVAEHDKAAWLGLFAHNALVNDPVGSRPHQSEAVISRFYDTFIAPNEIWFEIDHDIVCDLSVLRDVVIRTRMNNGKTVDVPTHIRYELVEEDGALRIASLRAYWELMPVTLGTLTLGPGAIVFYTKQTMRIFKYQGLGGMLGFTRGFSGVGKKGKRAAAALLDRLRTGQATAGLLTDNAQLECPAHTACSAQQLANQLQGMRWHKMIVAGHAITVSIEVNGKPGVALLDFNSAGQIERARFYLESE